MPGLETESDTLVFLGDAVKALADGRVGGYLVRYGDPGSADLQGDFFTKATDFGLDVSDHARLMFHHGFDPEIGRTRLGIVSMKADDIGIWAEGIIDKANSYAKAIDKLIRAGKLRWSSGSAPHCVTGTEVKGARRLDSWPIVEASLTPTPVEFRGNEALPLKAFLAAVKGEHLGADAGRHAAMSALGSLHSSLMERVHGHLANPLKTKPAKLAACKGCFGEHYAASMKCIKAMVDDGDGDEAAAVKAARARRLAAAAPITRV